MVIDLRSRLNFHRCHLMNSINLPLDCCSEEFFQQWDTGKKFISETNSVIKNEKKKKMFKLRKRYFIYVIAGQKDIQEAVLDLDQVLKKEDLQDMIKDCSP